ncbi:hypothetical protein BU26DRAFT_567832 [Trematosphaeria pertusa]|uniref:Uncharacterized protein n=1 Tax=Trematosphaeria pertusa TaxID=390896 RepID=A0A6A6I715_9PLEO|nr:uncharacterized protein BU26DRAFT_567832 [Trematosphaeria pertusa]KAF2246344.1 hypothetical protein BU26DRAFT_567832 [Trematosphaeria pertusa]
MSNTPEPSRASPRIPLDLECLYTGLIDCNLASTLRLIPSFEALTFHARPGNSPTPVKLLIGRYGDSDVYACPDGSVHRVVVRDSALRKKGTVLGVDRPMGDSCALVPPFSWGRALKEGLVSPMGAEVTALVQLYCGLWAVENGKADLDLPVPRYGDLVRAFETLQKAIETDKMLQPSMRSVQVVEDEEEAGAGAEAEAEAEEIEGKAEREEYGECFQKSSRMRSQGGWLA